MTSEVEARLAEIRAREQAATPGPWEADVKDQADCVVWGPKRDDAESEFIGNVDATRVRQSPVGFDFNPGNTEFIAHARSDVPWLLEQLAAAHVALSKINEIRNSIVGTQALNWSEHAYPLVAALNAAGVEGLPYPEARVSVGTLIDRVTKAEAKLAASEAGAAQMRAALERVMEGFRDHLLVVPSAFTPAGTSLLNEVKAALATDAGKKFAEEVERLRKENESLLAEIEIQRGALGLQQMAGIAPYVSEEECARRVAEAVAKATLKLEAR